MFTSLSFGDISVSSCIKILSVANKMNEMLNIRRYKLIDVMFLFLSKHGTIATALVNDVCESTDIMLLINFDIKKWKLIIYVM